MTVLPAHYSFRLSSLLNTSFPFFFAFQLQVFPLIVGIQTSSYPYFCFENLNPREVMTCKRVYNTAKNLQKVKNILKLGVLLGKLGQYITFAKYLYLSEPRKLANNLHYHHIQGIKPKSIFYSKSLKISSVVKAEGTGNIQNLLKM